MGAAPKTTPLPIYPRCKNPKMPTGKLEMPFFATFTPRTIQIYILRKTRAYRAGKCDNNGHYTDIRHDPRYKLCQNTAQYRINA